MTPHIFCDVLKRYLTEHIGELPPEFEIVVQYADARWFVQFLCGGRSIWAIKTRDENVVLDVLDEECLAVAERMRNEMVAA